MSDTTRHVTGFSRITVDPGVMGGRACIRGMRITAEMILGNLGAGITMERLREIYPDIEREDVLETIRCAAWLAPERQITTSALPSEAAA